jgi:hypothetical protein
MNNAKEGPGDRRVREAISKALERALEDMENEPGLILEG